jgi:hypothetical protein
MGTAQGSEQTTVSETGSFILAITGQQTSTTVSFAMFGCWLDVYPPCTIGPLVPGTMTGPMFTNGAWQFMTGGAYIFTDPVGQANANAGFWFGGNCIASPTSSYTSGNQTISPIFEGNPPFSLGQPAEASPLNSYSQMWAVLDSKGTGEGSSAPTALQMNTGNLTGNPPNYPPLQTVSGTAYPKSGASSGVYLPYTTSGSVNTFDGGGFYVEGGASVSLATSGASAQVYAISQTTGSGTTTTTITVDPLATPPSTWNCPSGKTGTTTVATQVGSGPTTTVNFCSVPMNLSTSTAQPGTMLYVNGTINSLSGPGQGQAAIQDGAQITITANGNIDITGDVIYKTEPVTITDNQVVPGTNPPCCNGDPVSTLIPQHDTNQVLGMFTANGNINLMSPYSNNNLQVDGSLAPLQQGSQYCFTCTGYINTFNQVGGQIQSGICGCDMSTQNTYFDRRFTARSGFAPPWFPSTTITSTGAAPAVTKPTIQRIQWVLKNM